MQMVVQGHGGGGDWEQQGAGAGDRAGARETRRHGGRHGQERRARKGRRGRRAGRGTRAGGPPSLPPTGRHRRAERRRVGLVVAHHVRRNQHPRKKPCNNA